MTTAEILAGIRLFLSIVDIVLATIKASDGDIEKQKELEIVQQLLRKFSATLPAFAAYFEEYKASELTINDLKAESIEDIEARVLAALDNA